MYLIFRRLCVSVSHNFYAILPTAILLMYPNDFRPTFPICRSAENAETPENTSPEHAAFNSSGISSHTQRQADMQNLWPGLKIFFCGCRLGPAETNDRRREIRNTYMWHLKGIKVYSFWKFVVFWRISHILSTNFACLFTTTKFLNSCCISYSLNSGL